MVPANFPESNLVLGKPAEMTNEDCDPLCVQRGVVLLDEQQPFPVVKSCWKLTADELEQVNKTGRVWLVILGYSMPPVILSGHDVHVTSVDM